MKKHYECDNPNRVSNSKAACGTYGKLELTADLDEVTCIACLNSNALWKAAEKQGRIIRDPPEPPEPPPNFGR